MEATICKKLLIKHIIIKAVIIWISDELSLILGILFFMIVIRDKYPRITIYERINNIIKKRQTKQK